MVEWWYYVDGDREVGPVPKDEFQSLVDVGRIGPKTMVWREGMEAWQPYSGLGRFASPMEGTIRCVECQNPFPADELIRFNDSYVCAACKPIFFQRVKEGVPIPGVRVYGTFWMRFGAKFIDGLLIGIVRVTLSIALGIVFALAGGRQPYMGTLFPLATFVIQIGVSLPYSVYFVGKFGATPGKMALGLKIINADESPVTYGTGLKRYLGEVLSDFTLGIGYIIAAFDEEKRALHDRICDTRVIKK